MLGNLNTPQCSCSIFTQTCAYVKLVGNKLKSEWIYTNKVLETETGFLRERRHQSGIIQQVRDEFSQRKEKFISLCKLWYQGWCRKTLILFLWQRSYSLKCKFSILLAEFLHFFFWVSNSAYSQRIKKCKLSTEGSKRLVEFLPSK